MARWDIPGLRELACEAVVSTARRLKGLRRLSSGLAAQHSAAGASRSSRERSRRGATEALSKEPQVAIEPKNREPLPRSRSTPTNPEVKAEKAPSSEYERSEDEEEDEESEDLPGAKRLAFAPGSEKPPEPAGPPPGQSAGSRGSDHHRGRDHHHHRGEQDGEERRKRKKRRAGRKHKNLSRLVENPHAKVHRSLDSSYWTRRKRDEEGFGRHK